MNTFISCLNHKPNWELILIMDMIKEINYVRLWISLYLYKVSLIMSMFFLKNQEKAFKILDVFWIFLKKLLKFLNILHVNDRSLKAFSRSENTYFFTCKNRNLHAGSIVLVVHKDNEWALWWLSKWWHKNRRAKLGFVILE